MISRTFAWPLILCAFSGVILAQDCDSRITELDSFILKSLPEFKVPGAAVGIIEDGKVVFQKGYGVTNIETKQLVDENTIFQMASVSKTFTATLAATLVQSGKLGWDEPIYRTLPEFVFPSDYGRRWITIRDLLAHRTGWPQFTGDFLDNLGYSRPQILERLQFLTPAFSLRETAQYSNPGFFVAGEVCARADGGTWNSAMEARVIKPLGMSRTFTTMKAISRPNSSANHALVNGKVALVEPSDQDTMGAAGGVTSTTADICKLLLAFVNGDSILKPATVEEMFARAMISPPSFTEMAPISDTTGFYYGMGVGSYDWADVRVVEKGGALAGVRTIIVVVPERKAAIVVLCNMNFTCFPEAVRAQWLSTLLKRDLSKDIDKFPSINKSMLSMMEMPEKKSDPKPFGTSLDGLLGLYDNELYGQIEIARDGDQLMVYAGPARFPGKMRHLGGGKFGVKFPGATVMEDDTFFTLDGDDKAIAVDIEGLGTFKRRKQ